MKRPRSPIFTILLLVVLPAAAALGVTLLVLNLIDGPQEPQTVMLPTFSGTARRRLLRPGMPAPVRTSRTRCWAVRRWAASPSSTA